MTNKLYGLFLVLALAALLCSCSKTEGKTYKGQATPDKLGILACTSNEICGTGRYCNKTHMNDPLESGLCAADCEMDMDCYIKDPEAVAAWERQKAQGIPFEKAVMPPLKFWCSPCGHCVEKTALADPACGPITSIPCNDDSVCGEGGVCHPVYKVCSKACTAATVETDCKNLSELTGYTYECADYSYFAKTEAVADGDAEGEQGQKAASSEGDTDSPALDGDSDSAAPTATEKKVSLCQEKWRETVRCVNGDAAQGDARCVKFLGKGFECSTNNVCSFGCQTPWSWIKNEDGSGGPNLKAENECNKKLGEGYFCMADGGRQICEKYCLNDSSCAYWGFNWECKFDAPIDPEKNFFSSAENSKYGRCVPREGVNYGTVDKTKESYKFVGVYGAVNDATFTNCGFPTIGCQDSVNIHHQLVKIYQSDNGDTVAFDGKYCNHQMANFRVDGTNRTKDDISAKDLAWMVPPKRYTLHIAYHHWNIAMSDVGTIKDNAPAFWTDWYPEGRGFLFEEGVNPAAAKFTPTSDWPMPDNNICKTGDDKTNATIWPAACKQWDQDRDGKIGITCQMQGVLQGEVYSINRAFQRAQMNVVKVLSDGRVNKLRALLQTDNESHVLYATKATYIIDADPHYYRDWDRSYTRLVRLPENATCKDIYALGVDPSHCGQDRNARVVDPMDDLSYICHTPTVDGPADKDSPVHTPPEPQSH